MDNIPWIVYRVYLVIDNNLFDCWYEEVDLNMASLSPKYLDKYFVDFFHEEDAIDMVKKMEYRNSILYEAMNAMVDGYLNDFMNRR